MVIAVLFLIYTDVALYQLGARNVMKDKQWIALRTVDFVLSVVVYFQSRQLGQMLDEKEQFFLDKGYKRGRLSSPFI